MKGYPRCDRQPLTTPHGSRFPGYQRAQYQEPISWRGWPQTGISVPSPAHTKPKKTLSEERPLAALCRDWRPWTRTRGTKAAPVTGEHPWSSVSAVARASWPMGTSLPPRRCSRIPPSRSQKWPTAWDQPHGFLCLLPGCPDTSETKLMPIRPQYRWLYPID